jgi:hypothetical protein
MKYLLAVLIPTAVFAGTEIEDAKRSIQSLIRPLMAGGSKTRPKGTEKFRVDACEKKKIDWMGILMMHESAELNFKFKEGCDIEGTIVPKILQSFPATLNLRNIQSYSKIETMNKVTANLEAKPILNLEMREGVLSGKVSRVKFEADYSVQINPVENKVVQKNLGGEIRISEINGKKVSIKEKILVE